MCHGVHAKEKKVAGGGWLYIVSNMPRGRLGAVMKNIVVILLMLTFAAGCDPGYTRVTNDYPEPVRLQIYTTGSSMPTDVTLSPGQNIIYRDPSLSVRGITVIAPNSDRKTYDSATLEKIAAAAHEKMETVQWSVRPEGISGSPQ